MNTFIEKIKEIWGWLVIVIGLLSSTMYFIIDTRESHKTIKALSDSNKILSTTVANHDGQIDAFNNAVKTFMENPPAELKYRLTELERKLEQHHGTSAPATVLYSPTMTPPTTTTEITDTIN